MQPMQNNETTIGGTRDSVVRDKTGKGWEEWFTLLDQAGAAEMRHPQIARFLAEQPGVTPWWAQKLTVAYEQERKGRQKHQMIDGYQMSVSRTLSVPVERLFTAWVDDSLRRQWLNSDALSIRKSTPNKSLRAAWNDTAVAGDLSVLFTAKETNRSQISIQHDHLSDAAQANQMKSYWSAALDRLKAFLEQP